jgi:signal transduction histidine kinase
MGEKTRLIQVFENLISNAVKHMGRPEGEIFVGCKELEDFWQFHVRDTGPGIAEKYFEKIFQIFQTLAARDDRESTGIGLAVVKKNVELFGGRIWVESTVGTGSTFYFTMPKSG